MFFGRPRKSLGLSSVIFRTPYSALHLSLLSVKHYATKACPASHSFAVSFLAVDPVLSQCVPLSVSIFYFYQLVKGKFGNSSCFFIGSRMLTLHEYQQQRC